MDKKKKIVRITIASVLSIMGIVILFPLGVYLWLYIPIKYSNIPKPKIEFGDIRTLTPEEVTYWQEKNIYMPKYLLTIRSNKRIDKYNPDYKVVGTTYKSSFSYQEIANSEPIIDTMGEFELIDQKNGLYTYVTAMNYNTKYSNKFTKIKRPLICKIYLMYYLIAIIETDKFIIPADKI